MILSGNWLNWRHWLRNRWHRIPRYLRWVRIGRVASRAFEEYHYVRATGATWWLHGSAYEDWRLQPTRQRLFNAELHTHVTICVSSVVTETRNEIAAFMFIIVTTVVSALRIRPMWTHMVKIRPQVYLSIASQKQLMYTGNADQKVASVGYITLGSIGFVNKSQVLSSRWSR